MSLCIFVAWMAACFSKASRCSPGLALHGMRAALGAVQLLRSAHVDPTATSVLAREWGHGISDIFSNCEAATSEQPPPRCRIWRLAGSV